MVEGINSTEGTGSFGNYVDYGSFEEVSIGSGASSAESPVPGVYTRAGQQVGRQPLHRLVLRRLRVAGLAVVQHQRRAGRGGRDGRRRPRAARRQPAGQLPRHERGHRRVPEEGQDLVVRIGPAASTRRSAIRTFRSSRTRRTSAISRAKCTYQLSQNNKLIGYYQPSTKVQKNRLDRQLLGGTAAIHLTEDASFRQDYSPLLWKAEWNSVIVAVDLLRGAHRPVRLQWPDTPNGSGISYEDLEHEHRVGEGPRTGSSTSSARRSSGRSATSRTRWAGHHNFKVGWEWFRETSTPARGSRGRTTTCCTCCGAAPQSEVMLFEPATSPRTASTRWDCTARTAGGSNNRLTSTLGVRFDQYRNFLPEQEHAAGPFTPEPHRLSRRSTT